MSDIAPTPPVFRWGYLSVGAGALALALSMLVIFGGPFTPQPTVGTAIGDIAGDIVKSAWRTVRDVEQPPPVARGWDIDRVLMVAAPLVGVLAVLLSVVSAVLREPWRLPTYGATLGGAAIVFHFVWWIALLVCGVILLMSIIENIGSFFDGLGG